MFYVYIGCLTFGVLYTVLSIVLGSHGFEHGGIDHGGLQGQDADDMPSPLNPVVIAGAIAAFGAAGVVGKAGFGMGELASAAFSAVCAAAAGTAVFFGIVKFFYRAKANTHFSEKNLINSEAEVLTPIPAQGVGEIVYNMNGMRNSLPAMSKHNEFLGRGETVIIQSIENHTAFVVQKSINHKACTNENPISK